MELNKKRLEAMLYLLKEQDFVSIESLAERCGISTRAMRYNLEAIEAFLVKKGFPYFEKERMRGVRLVHSPQLDSFIDQYVASIGPYQYQYSPQERVAYLLSTLLLHTHPIQTNVLCKAIGCSRNTVFKDLEQAGEWLEKRDLTLVKRPKVGIYVVGEEVKRRSALGELYSEQLPSQEILHYATGTALEDRFDSRILGQVMTQERAQVLAESIRALEQALGRQFSDDTCSNLILHLAVCIARIQEGVAMDVSTMQNLGKTEEYQAAAQTLTRLGGRLGIHFPRGEIEYFTYHLLGARVLRQEGGEGGESQEDERLLQAIRRMVREMEKIYFVDFGDQRESVINGIFTHLRPSINRIRYGLYLKNPLFDEIVSRYNSLFLNTRLACRHLVEYLGTGINDNEVAYLALHFGAALHKVNRQPNVRPRVLLACGTGLGSAMLITSQVEKLFDVEVVATVSGREAAKWDMNQVDYVISTVPLQELPAEKVIRVSPLFTEEEQERVGERLAPKRGQKARYDDEIQVARRLVAIVERSCEVKDPVHLQYEFLNELMNSHQLDVSVSYRSRLCDLLPRERISLGVHCSDWREAIAASARLLEEGGYISDNYQKAIIRNLEEYGPYMVMLPGMVLAHAGPEEGVEQLGMSLVTLVEPVPFGYKEYDPVRVVVTLAAVDQERHLAALAQLFRILKNPSCFRLISTTNNRDDICRLLAEHSN